MTAEDIIDSSIPSVTTEYSCSRVLSLMDTFKMSYLPVTENNIYIGIISEDEIYDKEMFDEPLKDFGVLKSPYVGASQHIFDVLAVASHFSLPIVPVINSERKYLGCITSAKLLEALAKITNVNAKGAVLVLEMGIHDYSMSEIARIVESENAKIISSYVTEYEDSTRMDITLVVNRTEISPVVKSLERYGYKVNAFFSGSNMIDDFYRDRYELLMNYMKI
ncbi:MAG: CBS domain-containing protein [Bacteroidales bacterium]|nr:CBS domain-containing protein [Bacteroidales bacterium]MBQ1694421.1 CBS domain-containing protein [Bacteroidales bacterium]MBQ2077308.1 CBS domain-containing protein [Bacteroidales bacterium]